jgi:phosphoserine phosphatase
MNWNILRITLIISTLALMQSCSRLQIVKRVELMPLNWDPFNRKQLENLVNSDGVNSHGFNPARPPYIVVDWDNTSIFLDIEEAVIVEMLQNLVFGASPELLYEAIRKDVPKDSFAPEYVSAEGKTIDIDCISADIKDSYSWLYANYAGLRGDKSLDEVKRSPHYMAFISKLRFLYDAIDATFGHAVSYPWATYLFSGMNEQEIRALTRFAIKSQLAQPIDVFTWTTPTSLPGRSGTVSVSWKSGLRLLPEMQNLYWTLAHNGFDIWVCSASFVDVVKEIASNPEYGYNIPENNIIAMELERDAAGRVLPKFRYGYDQTQEEGKTKAINRFLVGRYGYGPVLVCGDSEGDQNMMQDFPETKISLIINRLRSQKSDIGAFSKIAVETYGKDKPRYLLQGRDDNTGLFRSSQGSLRFGSEDVELLNKK